MGVLDAFSDFSRNMGRRHLVDPLICSRATRIVTDLLVGAISLVDLDHREKLE